ncbi:MAG: PilC/PilY family type IV pilus protein [Pseudomonadota bacterium]
MNPRDWRAAAACTLVIVICAVAVPASAKDTDLYKSVLTPNCMIMFDTSGSMDFGVYEYTEDYGRYYDYLSELKYEDNWATYDLYSGTGTDNYFYGPSGHRSWTRDGIYTVAGNIGYGVGPDGKGNSGDAGNWYCTWDMDNMAPTGWNVNLDGTHTITTDAEGHVIFNGGRLPNGRDIKVHDWVTFVDGSKVDRGLAGLLKAPGWYFSGYFLNDPDKNPVQDRLTANPVWAKADTGGRKMTVFFVPGNWRSMQCVYNLRRLLDGDKSYVAAWRDIPDESSYFGHVVPYSLTSPGYPFEYLSSYHGEWIINQPGAKSMKLHFDFFDVGDKCFNCVTLFDRDNIPVWTYRGKKGPFYSVEVPGDTVKIRFDTIFGGAGGWSIDSYSYILEGRGHYKIQPRIEVAREAISVVTQATAGKINWGLSRFDPSGYGVTEVVAPCGELTLLNLQGLWAFGGTPLCGAAQEMFNYFRSKYLSAGGNECAKNYAIYLTDGYPTGDDCNCLLQTGYVLTNDPPDGFTQDPSCYPSPPPDLMDDATGYAYTHDCVGRVIEAPESSTKNVVSHCIGFSLDMPLLEDAAHDGGGAYFVASNQQQLISAFYSLGLLITGNASYTAPVASVDGGNRTQHGTEMYLASFNPQNKGDGYWGGNVKRYGLDYREKSGCPTRSSKEWVVVDSPGGPGAADSTDCQGAFKAGSHSWWDADNQPDGDSVLKGGVGEVLFKSISPVPGDQYKRNIRTCLNGKLTDFKKDTIRNADLDVSSDSERYKIINWVYGFTYEENHGDHGDPVAKRWPLGDIIHSEPAIIQYRDPGSQCVTNQYLAVGANDGMLHVFDTDSGAEIWAFVPPDVLPKLKGFNPDRGANQQDLVDGSVTVCEVTKPNSHEIDKRIMVFGERRGGRTYYAFNITDQNPSKWELQWPGAEGRPGIMGGITKGFEELGQTWSKPRVATIGNCAKEQKVLIFGGGYDPQEDSEPPGKRAMGRAVYVVDLLTGTWIYDFKYAADSATYKELGCVPGSVAVVEQANGRLKCFYFADTAGNVWKTTYNGGEGCVPWATTKVFASNPGWNAPSGSSGGSRNDKDAGRKMFYPPDVSLGNTWTDSPVLYIGTGDGEHPLESTVQNRFYCIIDDGTGPLDEHNLLNVTGDELDRDSIAVEAEKNRIMTELEHGRGWYIKTASQGAGHAGEKVLAEATVFDSVVYFTTFTPASDVSECMPSGMARVYALNYGTGISVYDYTGDGKHNGQDRYKTIGDSIASGVSISIRDGKAAAFVSVGGGVGGVAADGSSNLGRPVPAKRILWHELDMNQTQRGARYGQ